MLPFLIVGGAALAALFLEGCDSNSTETNNAQQAAPDAGPSESAAPPPRDSASASPADSASSAPLADSSAPPDPNAPQFTVCDAGAGAAWKSSFTTSFLSQDKFKEITSGNAFCIRTPINLSSGICKDSVKFLPLAMDAASLDRRILKFNLESFPGSGERCPSLLSFKDLQCQPDPILGVKDVLSCVETPLLKNPYFLGIKVTLQNLLEKSGGTGEPDLLVQLSNGTGIFLSHLPPPCPPEGCPEVDFQ